METKTDKQFVRQKRTNLLSGAWEIVWLVTGHLGKRYYLTTIEPRPYPVDGLRTNQPQKAS